MNYEEEREENNKGLNLLEKRTLKNRRGGNYRIKGINYVCQIVGEKVLGVEGQNDEKRGSRDT